MQVIIPMAGLGSRFTNAGYSTHKPLIKVNGKSLIRYSVETLNLPEAKHIFVCRDLGGSYISEVKHELDLCNIQYDIHIIESVTSGAAETALLGFNNIDLEDELIITNSDQYLQWSSEEFLKESRKFDSSVLTYFSTDPKNSFAEMVNGSVVRLVEKKAISEHALVGVHYWKKAQYFKDSAEHLLQTFSSKETYISETYNYLIQGSLTVGAVSIHPGKYWSTGTPSDLSIFKGMLHEYRTKKNKTFFIDLDGTILTHAHKYSNLKDGQTLCPNVSETLDEIDSRGDRIILVSARKESSRRLTEELLESLGVPYDSLILGVSQGERVIINDVLDAESAQNNPRARAVNVLTNTGWTLDDID